MCKKNCKKQNKKENITQTSLFSELKKTSLPLDTLARLGELDNQGFKITVDTVKRSTLIKKARAKFMTVGLALKLASLESPLKDSYWNTYYCNTVLSQVGSVITSKYCNNRWCIICNRIRTAKMIRSYHPVIKDMKESQFVTLTVPNVKAGVLRNTIEQMNKDFRYIVHEIFRRRLKMPFNALKKLECTYNVERKDYHPHFHIVVENKLMGDKLIENWLLMHPKCSEKAQNIKPCDENASMELFKYFAKTCAKDKDSNIVINPHALDTMYQAMRKLRIYQNYGTFKRVSEDVDEISAQIIEGLEMRITEWHWLENDWVDLVRNEKLTGYVPSEQFEKLVKSISNDKLNSHGTKSNLQGYNVLGVFKDSSTEIFDAYKNCL